DAATAAALGALARQQGISLHALMLALLGIEVRRRTGRQGFLLGTAASSRHGAAQAGSIGYFVNMLPLARMPAPAATLAQVLAAMQESLARGLGHGRYPFARIYADFRRARGAGAGAQGSRYPLFDMGVTENPPWSRLRPAALASSPSRRRRLPNPAPPWSSPTTACGTGGRPRTCC
ncbi:condensation domain-containing protein, partial [Azovibrio restrictus]|uniref:condensation domain-containing protein n=1 Tax=Azovibrio restrictus TaxID=146938 RepID=UPI0026ED6B2A